MAKSKQKINEDILEMGRLMSYNRGLTSTENSVLNEQDSGREVGALVQVGGIAAAIPKIIKNYVNKLGSRKKFNIGMGSVNGDYLFETEPFEVEGVDLLDDGVVGEIVDIFYEAMDGGIAGIGTDEDKIYEGIKMCKTVVGMSQVAAAYQAEKGQNLRKKLINEMKDYQSELNRMFSMAERLPLISWKGENIKNLTELEKAVQQEKQNDTETSREASAVDYDLIKIDGSALPFDYAMSTEAQTKFNEYLDTAKYVKKYTPEFLAAQAIAKTSPVEIEIDYPGDGKIVAVVVEGKISGDGKGNITKSDDVTDVGDDTKDNTTDDKEGGDTKKSSGSSSWKKAPDSEPTEGDKTTFIKKGHYNKNNDSNVKKIQKALGIKEDGLYGNDTKAAVEKYQKENGLTVDGVVGHGTWTKMVGSEGKAAGETVTKAEENELDKVTIEKEKVDPKTLKDQIADLQTAIGSQPTKESCKTLIATAAAGLKRGVRLDDTNSLKQCYNSYNFGIGINSRKVKKGYNIKGKGN